MLELNKQDLLNISGGSKVVVGIIVGVVITFLTGFLDGITRPYKCYYKSGKKLKTC